MSAKHAIHWGWEECRTFARDGWFADGWSDGAVANLQIPIESVRQDEDLDLKLRLQSLPEPGWQTPVAMYVNGELRGRLHVLGDQWFTVPIPCTSWLGVGQLFITFVSERVSRLSDLGYPDFRPAVAFRLLEFAADRVSHSKYERVSLGSSLSRQREVGSQTDGVGPVFRTEIGFVRELTSHGAALMRELERSEIIGDLMAMGLIPMTRVCIDQDTEEFVLVSQKAIESETWTFPWEKLRDAALCWLEVNRVLLSRDPLGQLGLRDAHFGNFVTGEAGVPLWCDLGSVSREPLAVQAGFRQFVRSFLAPLVAVANEQADPISMRNTIRGAQPDGLSELPVALLEGGAAYPFVDEAAWSSGTRLALLNRISEWLESLDARSFEGTWSSYRGESALAESWSASSSASPGRTGAVLGMVDRARPGTLVDLGANDGFFSVAAARTGVQCYAIDTDEDALNRLYRFVRGHPERSVLPAYGEFGDVPQTGDMVLALALTHHLCLAQGWDFEGVVDVLAQQTSDQLLVEFMPDGLGGTPVHPSPSPDPLPDWYTLSAFMTALSARFDSVSVVDYDDSGNASRRVLIHASTPRGGAPGSGS